MALATPVKTGEGGGSVCIVSFDQPQLAGGVRKSFSLVAGIMLTGLLDVVVLDAGIKCVGGHPPPLPLLRTAIA